MGTQSTLKPSSTGHHLFPAENVAQKHILVSSVQARSFLSWTFGRSAIIRRIWPAVLLHTLFAAVVVWLSIKTDYNLSIPDVLLTILGVVIGFVISYRAMSGYDRYWQGRTSWSDVIRTSRTFSRFVWFHTPLRLGSDDKHAGPLGLQDDKSTNEEEVKQVHRLMAEKRMALDLIEAFSVALKHHLRGEVGTNYEDLYPLVKPLHTRSDKNDESKSEKGVSAPAPQGGENIPLEIVRCLSSWLNVWEERGNVPGTTLGAMFGCVSSFEDSLTALEKILTTPLPFVFSAHIRQTVWLYLFGLPFQLVNRFGWYTIPGVSLAAFTYLGFVASGEEMEQPFGYDENDLELDLFCRKIIHADIAQLKRTPCRNAFVGDHIPEGFFDERIRKGMKGRVEDIFAHNQSSP